MPYKIKKSLLAGSWYPRDKKDLRNLLKRLLENVTESPLEGVKALISPHAGYMFSGQVAAYGYHCINKRDFNRVLLMAPSHRYPLAGTSVGDYTHFETPLGKVPVSEKAVELKEECSVVTALKDPHEEEHSLEIQLPFLQMVLDDFTLIPVIFGQLTQNQMKTLSAALLHQVDENTLTVVSTDLSHFHPYEEAVSKDKASIDSILSMDVDNAASQEMCGIYPVLTSLLMAIDRGWSPRLLKYANSGDVTGDRGSVVGYASIAFQEAP